MKRTFSILLALVLMMTCCITGCAANTNDTADASTDTLGVKHFAMYIAFVIVFAIVAGAVVNLIV